MKTLAENIARVIADFDDIRNAIIDKGMPVPIGTPTSEYKNKIKDIQTTSSNTTPVVTLINMLTTNVTEDNVEFMQVVIPIIDSLIDENNFYGNPDINFPFLNSVKAAIDTYWFDIAEVARVTPLITALMADIPIDTVYLVDTNAQNINQQASAIYDALTPSQKSRMETENAALVSRLNATNAVEMVIGAIKYLLEMTINTTNYEFARTIMEAIDAAYTALSANNKRKVTNYTSYTANKNAINILIKTYEKGAI